jgi:hypothetical protein
MLSNNGAGCAVRHRLGTRWVRIISVFIRHEGGSNGGVPLRSLPPASDVEWSACCVSCVNDHQPATPALGEVAAGLTWINTLTDLTSELRCTWCTAGASVPARGRMSGVGAGGSRGASGVVDL